MTSILLEPRDRVAYLTINRPDALNAIDEDVLTEFAENLNRVSADTSIKALVITGAGDAFCVGLDIDLLSRAFSDLDYFRRILDRFKQLLLAVEALPVPVVVAVNGLARAGGFELILACDLVVISEAARIGDTHLAFGIVPGGGSTQRLPRRIGSQRARELILTGRWMSASEAAEAGLALTAVEPQDLPAAVEELADRFRLLSRPCLAATKSAMRLGADLPLEKALELELDEFMRYLEQEPTSREGYLAYVEGRNPSWP
ncbi:MAG: enoyl-CoA hydratase/isomerase family protein [Actinomycetota bacterium]